MQYEYNVDGPIDVRVVPAGGSCSGQSLGDIVGLCLTDSSQHSATVYYIPGKSSADSLTVLKDEAPDGSSLKLRFFNAIVGVPSVDFGLTKGAALPTSVTTTVASQVLFGHVPPPGNTALNVPVSSTGFLAIATMPAKLTWQGWGAATSGNTSAVAVVPFSTVSSNLGVLLTIVAAGKVGDLKYPVQFVGFSGAAKGGTVTPQQSPDASKGLN